MRGFLVGTVLWLAVGGVALAAASQRSVGAAVVVNVSHAEPAHMATYRGPDGSAIPVGACGAVVQGRLWVLPCGDPRVAAYRRQAAATADRERRMARLSLAGAVLALGVLGGGAAEVVSRRTRVRRGV